jgi:hypothetical protein
MISALTDIDESDPQLGSCLVARIKIADIGERDELLELIRRIPRDGLEQEADVVADVVAVEHLTDEPSGRVVEDRQSVRARVPGAARELVGAVASLAAEQPGEFAVLPRHKVHGEMVGAVCDPVGVVAFRQTDEERRGPMLTWLVNPTRQPADSSATWVVTTYIG